MVCRDTRRPPLYSLGRVFRRHQALHTPPGSVT
jgi:hypothetical protein